LLPWFSWACLACTDGKLDAFEIVSVSGGPNPRSSAGAPASAMGGDSATTGGGGAGSGGQAGAAAGQSAAGSAGALLLLLDDFEDGDTQGLGATEDWYPVNDGTGTQTLGVEFAERGPGTLAMHTRGEGFSDWGAKLGLDLSFGDQPLDGSGYAFLAFFARVEPETLTSLRVVLDDGQAYYGKDLELTQAWQQYIVSFAELTRPDGTTGLDRAALGNLQFFAEPSAPFDYWIDDVAFGRAP
jgi:hypothetical protein